MESQVYERIKKVFENVFDGLEEGDIVLNQRLFGGGLEISSFETVLLYLAVEDEFLIELPDDAYTEIQTIGDLVKCVEACIIP